uniref:protein-tyrosine-phosphatase n=1 Tax=Echinostoma caproni TaxID=27848 RepID=A0A183APD9_9TREM
LLCGLGDMATTNETHQVLHWHYTNWPDFGVPCSPSGLLNFLWTVQHPTVIHCSAGVGRSGAFVLIDLALYLVSSPVFVRYPQIISWLNTLAVPVHQTPIHTQNKNNFILHQSSPKIIRTALPIASSRVGSDKWATAEISQPLFNYLSSVLSPLPFPLLPTCNSPSCNLDVARQRSLPNSTVLYLETNCRF